MGVILTASSYRVEKGSMMTGNACVVFLILGNKNWENLVLLMVVGLSLILFTSVSFTFSKDADHD